MNEQDIPKSETGREGVLSSNDDFLPTIPWESPTPEMLASPEFEAVWQCIKSWDINVPLAYHGYCNANGNHVRAILDALKQVQQPLVCDLVLSPEQIAQVRNALGFARSVIKSGEPWTERCEEMIGGALDELK